MRAREFFDQLREIEADVKRAGDHIDELEAQRDQLKSTTLIPTKDNLNASWKLADLIGKLDAAYKNWLDALEGWVERQDEAMVVIQSLQHENTSTKIFWRDCLYWRFMCDRSLTEVAEITQHSVRAVEYAISCALDAVDAQGLVAHL